MAGPRGIGARLLLFVGAGCMAAPEPAPSPAESAAAIAAALHGGQLEQATAARQRARERHPGNATVLLASATLSALLWDDDRAARELGAALRLDAGAAVLPPDTGGGLGDLLFLAGRYGESEPLLRAGAAVADGERRTAFATLVPQLPWRRKAVPPLAAERPLVAGELPEFECAVGGRHRAFAIDTGTSMTTVSRSLAADLGARHLLPAGQAQDGAGRPLPVAVAVLEPFAVGDAELGPLPVLVVDDARFLLRDLHGGPERPVQAVLGLDVLSLFRITFDPVRAAVTFELPRGLPPEASQQCVRADGRCLVPVQVDGVRLWFVLDTGASDSSLTEAGLRQLPQGEQRVAPGFRRVRTLAGGSLAVREVRNLTLRCDQVRFRDVVLPVVARGGGELFPVHGVLGADLLLRCRLTLDRGRARCEAVE